MRKTTGQSTLSEYKWCSALITRGAKSDLPSSLVVVEVDGGPGVLSGLLSVHILFGNPLSEVHVIATTSPQPATTTCTTRKK